LQARNLAKETWKAIVEAPSMAFKAEFLAKTEEIFSKTERLSILSFDLDHRIYQNLGISILKMECVTVEISHLDADRMGRGE
jgi:hypothetical protein